MSRSLAMKTLDEIAEAPTLEERVDQLEHEARELRSLAQTAFGTALVAIVFAALIGALLAANSRPF